MPVSSLTMWAPQISFFTYYMGPPQISFLAYYRGAPQVSFFAYYMRALSQINFFCVLCGPHIVRKTLWGPPQIRFFPYYMEGGLRSVSSLTIGGPLRSVYSHTIWSPPQVDFFTCYMWGPP